MIFEAVNTVDRFIRAFEQAGRADRYTFESYELLFNYYNDLGESVELDVIEVCCDWVELDVKDLERETGYESIEELADSTLTYKLSNDRLLFASF